MDDNVEVFLDDHEPYLAVCPGAPELLDGFPSEEGGISEMSLDEEVLQELQWSAAKVINAQSKDLLYLVPVKIHRATQQLVAGILYNLELEVGQTEHLKRMIDHDNVKTTACHPKKHGKHFIYEVRIWVKKWENFEEVTVEGFSEAV